MKVKFLLLIFLMELAALSGFSQKSSDFFAIHKEEIVQYLDSICFRYKEHSYHNREIDFNSEPNFSESRQVFGGNVKLLNAPHEDAGSVCLLSFLDTVTIVSFNTTDSNNFEKSPVSFYYYCGDVCVKYYDFVIASNGKYGFVYQRDMVLNRNIVSIPETDYLIYQEWRKLAIVKNDFSRSIVFHTNGIDISTDLKYIAYSIDDYQASDYKSIYIFDLDNWQNNYLTMGFSPIFSENHLFYWNIFSEDDRKEKVYRYDLDAHTNKMIFVVPDSLTMWIWAASGDFVDPGRMRKGVVDNQKCIEIPLYYGDETYWENYIIKCLDINGKLIREQIKPAYVTY